MRIIYAISTAMREIALDTETTGIHPHEGHRIIEIGAVEMVNQFRTGKVFHIYINPNFEVSEGALKVHGLSNEFLADKPAFHEIMHDFLEFIADSRLIIHNASFDIGFLNHHLLEHKVNLIPHNEERVFDTLIHARKKYPGARNSLDALCLRFNIDTTARQKHGALLDAELLADVYAEMIGAGANQRNMLFSSTTQQGFAAAMQIHYSAQNRTRREAREFAVAAEELLAHETMLNSIKDPLWKKIA